MDAIGYEQDFIIISPDRTAEERVMQQNLVKKLKEKSWSEQKFIILKNKVVC